MSAFYPIGLLRLSRQRWQQLQNAVVDKPLKDLRLETIGITVGHSVPGNCDASQSTNT